jgi:hypothetical protein
MVLALATLLVCGFMVVIYRILRAEERQLVARKNGGPGWREKENATANQPPPQPQQSLARALTSLFRSK